MAGLTCDVCQHTFNYEHEVSIAVSSVEPRSYTYCKDCNRRSYEPLAALLAGFVGKRSAADVDKWLWENIVQPSLKLHGVEEADFWRAVGDQTAASGHG